MGSSGREGGRDTRGGAARAEAGSRVQTAQSPTPLCEGEHLRATVASRPISCCPLLPLGYIPAGPRVKKILFMAEPDEVTGELLPHWGAQLSSPDAGASILQAVPNMLELVPRGVNKWVGAQVLLQALGVPRQALMAVGDGGNDLELVANAGVGVAMGNAVAAVRSAATWVASSHDEDGIAEAFEKYVL